MPEGVITLEPIQVRIRQAPKLIGESATELYIAVKNGELDLIKDDKGRSYLLFEQLKARAASRQVVKPTEKPHLKAARDARWARHRAEKARQQKQQARQRKAR